MYAVENGCPYGARTIRKAAAGGQLKCMQYLHSRGCAWDGILCMEAAVRGQLKCLTFAEENGCPRAENIIDSVILNGKINLPCVKYLREVGCQVTTQTCEYALLGGDLSLLEYLHDSHCPWVDNPYEPAIFANKVNVLRYLHTKGFPWDEATTAMAAEWTKLIV